MIFDKLGAELHQKYTDNVQLSEEELKQLNEWYNYHDELEMKELGLTEEDGLDKPSKVDELLEKIKGANQRYTEMKTEIDKLENEREALRQKIADLYEKKRA